MPLSHLFSERPINIASLAIPEVVQISTAQFDKEIERLRPQIEEIVKKAREDNSRYTPGVLWGGELLLGNLYVNGTDIAKLSSFSDVARSNWQVNSSATAWYPAYMQLMGIPLLNTTLDVIKSELATYIDKKSMYTISEYNYEAVHALAAARILFPRDSTFSSQITPDLRSFVTRLFTEHFELGEYEEAFDYLRDFKVFFPNAESLLDTSFDAQILAYCEQNMQFSMPSRYKAVINLGIRKWLDIETDEKKASNTVESQPPVRRQF